jgi:hypothetical protein
VCTAYARALVPTKSHAAFARLVRVRVFVTRPLAKFSCVIHINALPPPRRRRHGELLVLAVTSAVDVPPPPLPTAPARRPRGEEVPAA